MSKVRRYHSDLLDTDTFYRDAICTFPIPNWEVRMTRHETIEIENGQVIARTYTYTIDVQNVFTHYRGRFSLQPTELYSDIRWSSFGKFASNNALRKCDPAQIEHDLAVAYAFFISREGQALLREQTLNMIDNEMLDLEVQLSHLRRWRSDLGGS